MPPARRRARGALRIPETRARPFAGVGRARAGREARCYRSTRRPELPSSDRAASRWFRIPTGRARRVSSARSSRGGTHVAIPARRASVGTMAVATERRVSASSSPLARSETKKKACQTHEKRKKKSSRDAAPRRRAQRVRRELLRADVHVPPEHDQDASAGARARGEPENPAPNPVPRALRRLLRRHPGVRARDWRVHGDVRSSEERRGGAARGRGDRRGRRRLAPRRARGRHQAAPASRRVENASRRAANRREPSAHPPLFVGYPQFLGRAAALRHRAGDDVRGAEAVARLRGRSSPNAARAGDAGRAAGAFTGMVTTPLDVLEPPRCAPPPPASSAAAMDVPGGAGTKRRAGRAPARRAAACWRSRWGAPSISPRWRRRSGPWDGTRARA